jgi:hypothetical protein
MNNFYETDASAEVQCQTVGKTGREVRDLRLDWCTPAKGLLTSLRI